MISCLILAFQLCNPNYNGYYTQGYSGAYAQSGAYVQQQVVYAQPQVVYVQPQPVYVVPQPVYVAQPIYGGGYGYGGGYRGGGIGVAVGPRGGVRVRCC